uniref:hypothetical protein n=1 Tax=Borreliella tanukii TaxID=56146 RepID=UPI003B21B3E1
MLSSNNNNLLQKNAISEEESLETEFLREESEPRKEKIQNQQDGHKDMTQGNLNSLSREVGELEEVIESNEIYFTIDSDLRANSDLQAVSGSNTISYTYEQLK